MARKKAARRAAPRSAAAGMGNAVVDATLAEAAAVGWRTVTLAAVARRAKIPLGQLLRDVPSRAHLVCKVVADVDARMLAGIKGIDENDSPRDRLFDVLMRRFDVLNRNREGMRALITGMPRDPAGGLLGLCALSRSMAVMLAAAGINAAGPVGHLRMKGLALIAAAALRVWMDDDSTDLAKTQAAVDRALERAEKLIGMVSFRRPPSSGEAAA